MLPSKCQPMIAILARSSEGSPHHHGSHCRSRYDDPEARRVIHNHHRHQPCRARTNHIGFVQKHILVELRRELQVGRSRRAGPPELLAHDTIHLVHHVEHLLRHPVGLQASRQRVCRRMAQVQVGLPQGAPLTRGDVRRFNAKALTFAM
eukprot:5953724-Pyramimonas_sp.AAC.1